MPRGYKTCPACDANVNTTAKVCLDCGYDFINKVAPSPKPPLPKPEMAMGAPSSVPIVNAALVTEHVAIINECLPDGWTYMGYFAQENNYYHIAISSGDAIIRKSLRELMQVCWQNL
jgi:hypothetical protein